MLYICTCNFIILSLFSLFPLASGSVSVSINNTNKTVSEGDSITLCATADSAHSLSFQLLANVSTNGMSGRVCALVIALVIIILLLIVISNVCVCVCMCV